MNTPPRLTLCTCPVMTGGHRSPFAGCARHGDEDASAQRNGEPATARRFSIQSHGGTREHPERSD